MNRRLSAILLPGLALFISCLSVSARAESLTYTEPFGIAHKKEVLELPLSNPVDVAKSRLLDAAGNDVPFQVSVDGKKLLLRTDLGPKEKLTWRLVEGKPAAADASLVTVTEDEAQGWYEITNGLTGVRIPNGKTFTDEWALLSDEEKKTAESSGWAAGEVKKKLKITPSNPAPVQGLRLRDGRWTAAGPNRLAAEPFCQAMKVEFLKRGPLETVVRVQYDFKAKAGVGRNEQYPDAIPAIPAATATTSARSPSRPISPRSSSRKTRTLCR